MYSTIIPMSAPFCQIDLVNKLATVHVTVAHCDILFLYIFKAASGRPLRPDTERPLSLNSRSLPAGSHREDRNAFLPGLQALVLTDLGCSVAENLRRGRKGGHGLRSSSS